MIVTLGDSPLRVKLKVALLFFVNTGGQCGHISVTSLCLHVPQLQLSQAVWPCHLGIWHFLQNLVLENCPFCTSSKCNAGARGMFAAGEDIRVTGLCLAGGPRGRGLQGPG